MGKKRTETIKKNEISELCEWDIGGYRQKVLIEGRKASLPVVLTLHGGPGTPIPFSVGCRGLFPEFTDRFIMVYWDQLGCGINNRVIDNSFTIGSFVSMAADLIGELQKRFPNNKIYLFSMSWGSILSARLLEKADCTIHGVVAWGQIVRDIFLNEEVLSALEHSKLPRKKLEIIKDTDREGASPRELQLISASIRKYTSGYQNKKGKPAPKGEILKGLLTSPDYSFRDFTAMINNGYRKNTSLWKEILALDLSDILRNVRIPYLILQGDTDIVASTRQVQKLVETSRNENLRCKIVENSGHMPGKEGIDMVLAELCEETR